MLDTTPIMLGTTPTMLGTTSSMLGTNPIPVVPTHQEGVAGVGVHAGTEQLHGARRREVDRPHDVEQCRLACGG